jgi:hypothetical protein
MRLALVSGLSAFLLASPAFAQSSEPPGQTVTVTGQRLQSYRDRLAACIARHCPVNEDVDATLALAEALFLDGKYGEARGAVLASLGRNGRQAARFPEPVSDLYRANTRLSRHLGFDDAAARSAYNILRSLQAGLSREDHRHFTARFEIAELQMQMGYPYRARDTLAELIRIARANGREDVAVMAELRSIWFDYLANRAGDAAQRLEALTRSTDPSQRLRRAGAIVLLARIYRANGEPRRADAVLAQLPRSSSQRRRLLSAPPYQLIAREVPNASEVMALGGGNGQMATQTAVSLGGTINRVTDNYRDKWIDVGFWVMPDGQVSGVEILRRGSEETAWSDPLLESIRGRRYSSGAEPVYRLERYTYTAGYGRETGTRLLRQSPNARVEYLDLTTGDERPGPPPRPEGGRPIV